jgi:hypothetical protein
MTPTEAYVRDLADRMGLRDWTLRVDLTEPDAPDRRDEQRWGASAHPLPGRKYAIITLGTSVSEADPDEQRQTIVHELVHLHFGALVDQLRNDLDDFIPPAAFGVFDASATRNLEYGVDALAVVIAEHMPLPPG